MHLKPCTGVEDVRLLINASGRVYAREMLLRR